jgi:hypothetical protein
VSNTRLEVNSENEHLAPGNSDDVSWTELCITADQDLQDRLLVEVLAPFIRHENAGRRAFFVRDRVDTTLRLRILVTGCTSDEVDELAGAFRALAEKSTTSAEVSVLPHTSLEKLLGPYGGSKAPTLLSDFFVDLCGLMLDQIAEVVAGRARRLTVALDIMVSHLHAIDVVRIFPERYPKARPVPGCPVTFPMYRSNVDGFFVMSMVPEVARQRVNEQYESVSASIHARVAAVLAQFYGTGPVVSDVGLQWHQIANKHLYRADAAIACDALTVKWDKGYIGDNFDLTVSPFHQVVQGSPPLRSYYRENQGYLAARFLVSSTYLALTSLGVRIMERFFLCHSITRACEEIFGVDATEMLREVAYVVEAEGYSAEEP